LVLFRHSLVYSGGNFFLTIVSSILYRGGWVGVDLFFVLSGFLIAGLLFDEQTRFKTISFKTFFIRRGYKIYPLYYVMTLGTLGVLVAAERNFGRPAEALPWLVYLQDYIYTPIGFLWGHLWSLAVEEKFYVLLPLLLILLAKGRAGEENPFKPIPALFVLLGFFCLGLRLTMVHRSVPYNDMAYLEPFHLRMDSLCFGVLIAYLYHFYPARFREVTGRFRKVFLWGGMAFLVPAFLFQLETTPFIYSIGFTLFYIGSGAILAAVLENKTRTGVGARILAYLGVRSYSIYLWHFPLAWLIFDGPVAKNLRLDWFASMALYWAAALGLGILVSNRIEIPLLRFRDRQVPSRTGAVVK
jgi:peptidoglycan/LPS O-acetylase OafA/YrhL